MLRRYFLSKCDFLGLLPQQFLQCRKLFTNVIHIKGIFQSHISTYKGIEYNRKVGIDILP